MDKVKKTPIRMAMPFIVGILAFFMTIFLLAAIIAEMIAVIGSDAGANNKKHREEEAIMQINLSSLDRYKIFGEKVGNKYILTFSFSGWEIEEIELEDIGQSQSVTVRVPAISGTREEMAYSFLVRKGFTPEGACGMLANIAVESGHTWRGTTEEGFLEAYQGKDILWQGYGLCQWTNTENAYGISWRRRNLINHLESRGLDPTADSDELFLEQLNYAITETGYENIVSRIKTETDPNRAAEIWCREWEVPANVDASAAHRGRLADEYFANYKNKNVNISNADSYEDVTLTIKIEKEGDTIYFDGELNGIDIAGSFKNEKDELLGSGTYGPGAYSRGGALVSPYGTQKFYLTSLALVYRTCPIHGPGELHGGWDLCYGGDGTPIYSVSSGKVILAGPWGGFGNHCVVIQSGDLFTIYGHMCEMFVSVGDEVAAGDRIGSQGNEGNSAGSHLHLEFRRGSMYGEAFSNLEAIKPVFMEYVYNYNSAASEFNQIVR